MAEQAVYWVGQDGNVYYGNGQGGGVKNMGKLIGEPTAVPYRPGQGFDAEFGSAVAQRIDDPNPGGSVLGESTTAQRNTGGGTIYKPFNQAGVDATNASIASLDTVLANALASAQAGYDNNRKLMNEQEASTKAAYDADTLRNQQNYDANLGASVRAGATGLQGLMSALRGGGGGGNRFARDWVQNTVADTTANDIREGYNTFDENRRGLDSAQTTFVNELGRRRAENEDTLANNRRAANLYDAQQRQNLLQTLSGLYGEAGRLGEAGNIMKQSAAQAPRIAENMGAQVSAYNSAPIKVESPDMTAFTAPEQQSMSASDSGKGTGIFSMLDPRRREKELAGV